MTLSEFNIGTGSSQVGARHAPIFYFRNGGDEEVYLASADWMARNLDHRVELLFPVEAEPGQAKVTAALDALFQDNVKGWRLSADGTWKRRKPGRGEEPFRAQIETHRETQRALGRARARLGVSLEPITAPEGAA